MRRSLPFKLIRQTGIIRIKVITIAWSIAIWTLLIITLFVALQLCCVVDLVRLVQMDSTMRGGSDYERDAFKFVVEWLHGDRVAYADREGTIQTKADWSYGNVCNDRKILCGNYAICGGNNRSRRFEDDHSNRRNCRLVFPAEYAGSTALLAEKEVLNSFLAYYCSSRYHDESLSEKQLDDMAAFHHELSLRQLKCGFDYDEEFWGSGNYCLNADKIRCTALIVHGLNDENVSTKQFEMMYKSFEKAGRNVKLLLHPQGAHITPTMSNREYGILVEWTIL